MTRRPGLAPTTGRQIVVAALAGAVVGWMILGVFDLLNVFPPVVPWTVPTLLLLLAAAAFVYARTLPKRLEQRRVPSEEAVRAMVMAKSLIMTGALLAGGHAVYVGRWLSLIALPSLLGTGLLLVLKDVGPNPLLAWALFAATAVVVTLTSRVLRRRGLHIHEAILANTWGIGLLIANHAWVSVASDSNRYDLWTTGLTTALMVLTIPGRQWKEATGLMLANVTASIAGALGLFGQVPKGTDIGAPGAIITAGVVTLVLALGASDIGKHAHLAQEERTEEQLAEQLRNERVAEQEAWIAALDRICGPLFTGLYTGAVDPADPAVRIEARHVESRLRDALRLWPGGIHLATSLDRLRRMGWGCLLDVEQVEAFEATRFASLLNQLEPAVPGQHLTITRRQGTLVATVAEPGLTETRQAGLTGARILLTDPDFTQFSCEEDQP